MTFGESEKEAIYTIVPHSGSVESFKGRAHPQADPDIIKPLPNTAKGIFCKRCEEAFGRLEDICQPQLNDHLQSLYKKTLTLRRVKEALKAFSIPVPSNITILFFYTVIWRQCLQNKTDLESSILPDSQFQYLQSILLNELYKKPQEIQASQDFLAYPRISIFTSKQNIPDDGWANPSFLATNPELFFLGRYSILYFKHDKNLTKNLFSLLGIPTLIQGEDINLKPRQKISEIIVVPEKIYNQIVRINVRGASNTFMMFHIKKVAACKGLSLRESEEYLRNVISRIRNEIEYDNFSDYVSYASNLICN
ncbi:MAG: hypothetical protein ABI594_14695 [Ginsengibacter sp.]